MRGLSRVFVVIALAALPSSGGSAIAFAQSAAPPTLSGESFHQDTPTITSLDCVETSEFTYSATGTATGPYPGTFTETGAMFFTQHSASFTIDSPVGHVTGTKTGAAGLSCSQFTCSEVAECEAEVATGFGASFNTDPSGFAASDTYEATITTADGTFADHGVYRAVFYRSGDNPLNGFDERYRSALDAPEPVAPTRKGQCKQGGWERFGFKNQGQCIRAVKHGPR